jgi:hypothetical protein
MPSPSKIVMLDDSLPKLTVLGPSYGECRLGGWATPSALGFKCWGWCRIVVYDLCDNLFNLVVKTCGVVVIGINECLD